MPVLTLAKLKSMKKEIEEIAASYGVTNLRVFGSIARGDANEDSDVDLLVDRTTKGIMALGGFKMDMEDLLGRKTDIVTMGALKNSLLRERILREATPL